MILIVSMAVENNLVYLRTKSSLNSIIFLTNSVLPDPLGPEKIAIRGDGKSPDQKVIDMQLQAANLVYIFDVIILSVTANKSGRLTVETSFLPLNSSKGGTLKCKP